RDSREGGEAFEVRQNHAAAFRVDQALAFELRQRQRDGLARRTDQVRHLLVRDLEAADRAAFVRHAVLLTEVEQQFGELRPDVLENQLLDARLEILAAQDQRARDLVRGAAIGLEQAVEQLTPDFDRYRRIHRLGHLLARAALEQAGLAEEVALGALSERQLLAVARDLRDLDAALRQEVEPLRAVAGQV